MMTVLPSYDLGCCAAYAGQLESELQAPNPAWKIHPCLEVVLHANRSLLLRI